MSRAPVYAHDVNAADAVIREIVAVRGDRPNGVHDWRAERDIIARAILAERERCAQVCETEARLFLSPEYASNQPLGSITERFACDECAKAIRKGAA